MTPGLPERSWGKHAGTAPIAHARLCRRGPCACSSSAGPWAGSRPLPHARTKLRLVLPSGPGPAILHAAWAAGVRQCHRPGDTPEPEEVPFPFKCKSQPRGCGTGVQRAWGGQRAPGRASGGTRGGWRARGRGQVGTTGRTGTWRRSVVVRPPPRAAVVLGEGGQRLWTKGLPQPPPAAPSRRRDGPRALGVLGWCLGG